MLCCILSGTRKKYGKGNFHIEEGVNQLINIKKILYIILPIICFVCNISQLPSLWNNSFISVTYMGLWIFTLLIACFYFKYKIFFNRVYLHLLLLFDGLILLLQVLLNKNYINSNFIFPIHLSFFVMFTSGMVGRICDRDLIKKIANAYIISTCLIGGSIYIEYFQGEDWLNATGYLYTAKNSVAIIFLSAIILIYFYWLPKYKIMSCIMIVMLSSLIFMMKSRATILVWLILAVYIIVVNRKTVLGKIAGGVLCIGIILLVTYHPMLHEIFVDNIFLNNRGSNDYGVLTSGRDEHYEWFGQHFGNYWLTGTGGTYLESFPLAVLMSYGVIGAVPLFIIAVFPFFIALKTYKNSLLQLEVKIIMLLNIILVVNGFFEELTPFGPGVKCYALWMMTGLYLGLRERENVQ